MKPPLVPLFAAILAAGLAPGLLRADVVTLKSGDKVEGSIIAETDGEVRIAVKVSAAISEEQVIPRAEIAAVQKAAADAVAFAELAALRLDPQRSQPQAWYDKALASIEAFKKQYPASPHLADAVVKRQGIAAERDRVAAGEIKFGGRWYTKEQAAERRAELESLGLLEGMRAQVNQRNWLGALATFDLLEQSYPTTRTFPDAVGLAKTALGGLDADVSRYAAQQEQAKRQQKEAVDAADKKERKKLELELKAAAKQDEERFARALATTPGKWKPLVQRSEASIKLYRQLIPPEVKRLGTIPAEKMSAAIEKATAAEKALAADDAAGAKAALAEAAKLWPASDMVRRLQAKVDRPSAKPKGPAAAGAGETTAETAAATGAAGPAAAAATKKKAAAAAEEKPFYLTLQGSLLILGGAVALVLLFALLTKLRAKRKGQEEAQ